MPIFPDNAQNHSDQGMTEGDIRASERIARRRNEIIMFRSTGPWSRPHIEAGHPTKPFHVKGKSSTWGPHAGFVPLNSKYSKAILEKDVKKGSEANHSSIRDGYARPVPVVLSDEYIRQYLTVPRGMMDRPAVDRITQPRDDVMYFHCLKPGEDDRPSNKKYLFLGKRKENDWQIFSFPDDAARQPERALFLRESAAEPLLVMAVPGSDLPITGDYDLFAICPSWADYGARDLKMDPTLDDPRQNRSFKRTQMKAAAPGISAQRSQAQRSLALINAAKTVEDPDRGNLTPRIFQVVCDLNAAMGVAYGPGMKIGKPNIYRGKVVNQRVHHNAESGRPFAPGAEDGFPLTLFHPGPVGPYHFANAVINDIGDLKTYFKTIFSSGYYVPRNPAWEMPALNSLLVEGSPERRQFEQSLSSVMRPR